MNEEELRYQNRIIAPPGKRGVASIVQNGELNERRVIRDFLNVPGIVGITLIYEL
jgi:hypothetical protein